MDSFELDRYYRHSGRIGSMGPPLILLFGAATSAVLGFIYAYAIVYIPFIYLNLILTLLYGAGVGATAGLAGKLGKVRNRGFMVGAGIVVGLLAVYVSWVGWILAMSKQQLLTFAPGEILSVIAEAAEEGVWSISGSTPTGVLLYLVWIVEALLIIGATAGVAMAIVSSAVFCEPCDRWLDTFETSPPLAVPASADVVGALENGDCQPVLDLSKADVSARQFWHIELTGCSTCDTSDLLSIKAVEKTFDKKGKEQVNAKMVVEHLRIPRAVCEKIRQQHMT